MHRLPTHSAKRSQQSTSQWCTRVACKIEQKFDQNEKKKAIWYVACESCSCKPWITVYNDTVSPENSVNKQKWSFNALTLLTTAIHQVVMLVQIRGFKQQHTLSDRCLYSHSAGWLGDANYRCSSTFFKCRLEM